MKVCLIKQRKFGLVFNRSIYYKDMFLNGTHPYEYCNDDLAMLGFLLGLEADFLIFEDKEEELQNYDVIISIGPFLQKKYKQDQKLCYFNNEPEDIAASQGIPWDSKNDSPNYPYDFLLNNFEIQTNNDKNVPFYYYYDFNQFEKMNKKNQFFIQRRTDYVNDSVELIHEKKVGNERRTFKEYQRILSSSLCVFNLCTNKACGQLIAESILSNTICFAREMKLFSKLILPKECYIESTEDIDKIINNKLYINNDLLEYSKEKIKILDIKNAKKDLLKILY
jgi:hypothetical protein